MAHLQGAERAAYVRAMFGRIAPRYDLLNRLMTFGRDKAWRRETVRRLHLPRGGRVLDLGTGTGDLALEAKRQDPSARTVAADFAPAMLALARRRSGARRIGWLVADAGRLPFPPAAFDAVVSGFLLRNLADLDGALAEIRRVLRPSGSLACLDTTPPPPGVLRPLIEFHLRVVIPALGRWIAGDSEAYNYLPGSTRGFLAPAELARRLERTGFADVGFVRRMFGTIAIHWGRRPASRP